MKFEVYHTNNFTEFSSLFTDHNQLDIPQRPIAIIEPSSEVEAEALDQVFEMTQHIDQAWFGQTPNGIKLCIRSSAVGDVFVNKDSKKAWVVDRISFVPYEGNRKF